MLQKKKTPLWAEKWGMSSNRPGQCVLVVGELARTGRLQEREGMGSES